PMRAISKVACAARRMDLPMLLEWVVGAVGGAALVSLLRQLRFAPAPPATRVKLTASWRLSELDAVLLAARDVEAEVPAGAQGVASGRVHPDAFAVAEARQVPDVTAEVAVDASRGKAILFLAGVRPGALALVTTDRELVQRLAADAQGLWERSKPYVEQRP